MPNDTIQVRPIAASHYAAVVEIYNYYIDNSHYTFDLTPFTIGQRVPWFAQFTEDGLYQCLVAVRSDEVLGYACSTPFRAKPGYITSVDVSVYIDNGCTATGVGSRLYQALFARLAKQPIHRIFAGIALPNDASTALHQKFGFNQVAHFTEAGIKFDQYWDVIWLERPNSAA